MRRETLAVDWGTSACRAWRCAADGNLERLREVQHGGILHVERGGFEPALRRLLGSALQPGAEVWLSGMVTSRNGWVETPYLPVPVRLDDLACGAVVRELEGGIALHFLPGVSQRHPSPDVMRGEEMQVLGALDAGGPEGGLFVLPGTHSKWVRVAGGTIVALRTHLTGECHALLREHSIVGRLIEPATSAALQEAAFVRGVNTAQRRRAGGLLHEIFTARSAALLGELDRGEIADFLSGLLIGHELREELAAPLEAAPTLIGAGALVARYRLAFDCFGIEAGVGASDAAARGLARVSHLARGAHA